VPLVEPPNALTHSEPRFRALLTEGDAKHLALEWT